MIDRWIARLTDKQARWLLVTTLLIIGMLADMIAIVAGAPLLFSLLIGIGATGLVCLYYAIRFVIKVIWKMRQS